MNEIVEVKQPQVPSALQHGILSRHLLLQSEDHSEYVALLESLRAEHLPEGVTEQHLVEELAGIMWRKRRLRIAETAHHRKQLRKEGTDSYNKTAYSAMIYTNSNANIGDFSVKKALACTDAENQNLLEEIEEYRQPAIKALALLEEGGSYEAALALLAEGTRAWWQEDALGHAANKGNFVYQANTEHLQHFLRLEGVPYYSQEHEEVLRRPLVRQQAEGEAFIPDDTLEKFARYEVHLDRKFERTLTVLIRLQDMRKGKTQISAEDEAT